MLIFNTLITNQKFMLCIYSECLPSDLSFRFLLPFSLTVFFLSFFHYSVTILYTYFVGFPAQFCIYNINQGYETETSIDVEKLT